MPTTYFLFNYSLIIMPVLLIFLSGMTSSWKIMLYEQPFCFELSRKEVSCWQRYVIVPKLYAGLFKVPFRLLV